MQGSMLWAVSPRFDKVFLLSSLVVPFLFYGLYLSLEGWIQIHFPFSPELVFFVIFTAVFDAPHIVQTFFRTHGGSEEFRRHPWFHNLSLVVGLSIVLGGYSLGFAEILNGGIGLFGGWHIMRQNIGFLKVYQRKESKNHDPIHSLELKMVYGTWIYFLLHEGNTRSEWFPSSWLLSSYWKAFDWSLTFVWLAFFFSLIFITWKRKDRRQIVPKSIFLYGQALSFFIFAQIKAPFLVIIAVTTIAHNLQYFGWMGRYYWGRSNRWRLPILPFAFTWLFGLLLAMESFGRLPENWIGRGFISFAILYNGLVLWHYFIDGFIWRFKSQPELNKLISN